LVAGSCIANFIDTTVKALAGAGVMARALQSHRNSVRPSVVKILVLWMLEKYTHARSLYEAVGYRLESERQKQIITLKAPLGDGEYVRTAHVAQRGSRPGEGTSS
jgi:hypothetical protein